MDRGLLEALHRIGGALDSRDVTVVGDLRLVLSHLSSFAERREVALERPRVAVEARRGAEDWYRLLPAAVRWRSRRKRSGQRARPMRRRAALRA